MKTMMTTAKAVALLASGLVSLSMPLTVEATIVQALPYMNAPANPYVGRKVDKASKSAAKKKKVQASTRRSDADAELASKALQELEIAPESKSASVVETPATVTATPNAIAAQTTESELEVGFSLQSFRPQGRGHVTGFDSYDLAALGEQPMPAVELRWLPLALERFSFVEIGGALSVGYAQHAVNLRGPTGVALEKTKLHSVKSELMAAARASLPGVSAWAISTRAGLGRLDSLQSGESAATNDSNHLVFAGAGAFVERRIVSRLQAYAGYEYRAPILGASADLGVQRNNLLLGVWGSFQ